MFKVLRGTFIRFVFSVVCVLCLSLESRGEVLLGPEKELFVVDEIQIEGAKKVEHQAIFEKMMIKKGVKVDNYLLRKDIANIYSLKYFEQITTRHVKKGDKDILLIEVIEKPTIQRIRFDGNSELSSSDLKEQIKTKSLNILDVSTLKSDLSALQKFYEEKGFYLAKIDFHIEKISDDFVEVIFDIQEFDKVKVKQITFLGNKELSDSFLKNFMQTRENSFFSFMSGSGSFKEFDFQTDLQSLNYIYRSHGFLQVNITNPIITVSEDKKWIFITININEGPKFSVNDVYFEGDIIFSEKELFDSLQLKKGDIYSEEKLRKDIDKLTELFQDEGHAFANVLRNLEVVPGENKVDIRYTFEKGNEVKFGIISITGNTRTRDKVIRRELRIHEGMKYSGSKLRISKERVTRLGYFEPNSVVFKTVPAPGTDDVVNVEIGVKEAQTGQLQVGAGYSSATGVFFQGSVSQNNFLGTGRVFNFNFQKAGEFQTTYRLGLTDPYFLDTRWTLGGDVFNTNSNLISSFSFEKKGFDIRTGYPIYDNTHLFLTYRYEETNVERVRNPTIDKDLENGVSSSIQLAMVHDQRDHPLHTTKGYYLRGASEFAGVGGDQDWLRAEAEGRFFTTLIGSLVLRTRFRFAQLYRTTDKQVPRTQQFQMGGPRNMRGYDIEGIGPREVLADADGNLRSFNTGGLFSALANIELEHPLVQEAGLKWVLFYDAGNVYKEYIGKDGNFDLRSNYGFGFRWISPIGVLRFEFGYPINKRENEAAQQFFFDIGQLF